MWEKEMILVIIAALGLVLSTGPGDYVETKPSQEREAGSNRK